LALSSRRECPRGEQRSHDPREPVSKSETDSQNCLARTFVDSFIDARLLVGTQGAGKRGERRSRSFAALLAALEILIASNREKLRIRNQIDVRRPIGLPTKTPAALTAIPQADKP
jgi:hypothetical protein